MTNPSNSFKPNFSLTTDGPVALFFIHLGFMVRLKRRILIFAALTWLPLLFLSALQGLAIGNAVKVPFLLDIAQQIRLLVVIPLLFLAEPIIGLAAKETVEQFLKEGLVPEPDFPAFQAIIHKATYWQESALPEAILIILVIVADIYQIRSISTTNISTWLQLPSSMGATRSLAGWWFLLISLSIYRFLIFRWLWRFLIWSKLLWQMSKLHLQLMPTHPDRTGGLAFLGDAQLRFAFLVFSMSTVIAAGLANMIIHGERSPFDFKVLVSCHIIFAVLLVLLPLFAYSPKLIALKKRGQLRYGILGMTYTRSFDNKWIQEAAHTQEPLLGSADIQSLADLANSFEVVKTMNIVPFDLETVKILVLAAVLPFIPLVLGVIPLQEIWEKTREFLL
jgi:hypothetical protein